MTPARILCSCAGLAAIVLLGAAGLPARGAVAPGWTLDLRVARWIAPSSFSATIAAQRSGPKVRIGFPVTLVLDRRTRCSISTPSGRSTRILCATLRPRVAARPSLRVTASGQFETGHRGAIGFRARTVLVRG